jgi:hypothetical protein
MKNEDISKLVEEFVRRVKLYESKYGRDDFWKACLRSYTNELQDWHDSRLGGSKKSVSEQRKTIITNTLLDAIWYMSKKNIKESMKKSELKALIKEVIEEMTGPNYISIKESDENVPWGQHKDDWLPGGAGDPAHDKKN